MGKGALPEKKLSKFLLMYTNTLHATTGGNQALMFMKRTQQCKLNVMKPNTESRVVDKLLPMGSKSAMQQILLVIQCPCERLYSEIEGIVFK